MTQLVTLGMAIWIHAHADTDNPARWELSDVTGLSIPVTLLEDLATEKRRLRDMDIFAELELDQWYYVIVVAEHNPIGVNMQNAWFIADMKSYTKISDSRLTI